jgi:hypothetical protein
MSLDCSSGTPAAWRGRPGAPGLPYLEGNGGPGTRPVLRGIPASSQESCIATSLDCQRSFRTLLSDIEHRHPRRGCRSAAETATLASGVPSSRVAGRRRSRRVRLARSGLLHPWGRVFAPDEFRRAPPDAPRMFAIKPSSSVARAACSILSRSTRHWRMKSCT